MLQSASQFGLVGFLGRGGIVKKGDACIAPTDLVDGYFVEQGMVSDHPLRGEYRLLWNMDSEGADVITPGGGFYQVYSDGLYKHTTP